MKSKLIKSAVGDLDSPILPESQGWFKKGKIRVLVINEDSSFKEHFLKLPDSYVFDIKNKSYLLIPKCVIGGKFPTIVYFYNNPCPIFFKFEYSKITAQDLRTDEQLKLLTEDERINLAHIHMDSESINLAFNSRVMRGLYARKGLTLKTLIIILAVVLILVLIMLQVFGVVDVWGALTGQSYVKK